ncbi:hypothetical protein CYMTET_4482 [Cymbomonas tetramitiformis]|uniref:Uncharacterized protein n=1 Tax=Cymbomonas tetramitiformis TaxID=36881 RepID=A0AAE0H1A6_9CHLO|nr:hypothetical protein CYMTET_4482 [Cymbomonas tetramitiformis]
MSGGDLNQKNFQSLQRKSDPEGTDVPSPDQPLSQDGLLRSILALQQQQAEEQRLLREQLLQRAKINEQLQAQIAATAAKSRAADPGSSVKTADQMLERRRNLAYVPEAVANPFPCRPATLTTRMP